MRALGAVPLRRQLGGLAVAVIGLPVLTWLLSSVGGTDAITTDVLLYQLLVVVVALIGGLWPALVAAVGAGILLDYFFVAPLYTVTIAAPQHLVALVVSLLVAALVSFVVDQAARRLRAARASAAESEQLAKAATAVLGGDDAVEALVRGLCAAFALVRATLVAGRTTVFSVTSDVVDDTAGPTPETVVPVGTSARLVLRGRVLTAVDHRILAAFTSQLAAALERRSLAAEAAEMRPIAAADRLRSALLSAVGHDLRRPLAAATAAVTSLRSPEVQLSEPDRGELLATADESLRSLADLVTDLLDASRLQAGVLGVTLEEVAVDEVVGDALDEIAADAESVGLDFAAGLGVTADPALLKRVIVNLLTNALRYSPAGRPPTVEASASGERVQIRVIDHGPGIPHSRMEEVFAPFQRLGDTDNGTGIGLGLALSKGFVEGMSGTLDAEETPGGGLTMVIDLNGSAR